MSGPRPAHMQMWDRSKLARKVAQWLYRAYWCDHNADLYTLPANEQMVFHLEAANAIDRIVAEKRKVP